MSFPSSNVSLDKENELIFSSNSKTFYSREISPRQPNSRFSKECCKSNVLCEVNVNLSAIHSANFPSKNNRAPLRETHHAAKLDGNKNVECKIKKAINHTKEVALSNSTALIHSSVNFMRNPEIANFEAVGTKPKINFEEKRPLGSGISKVVSAIPTLSITHIGLPETPTAIWKERAVAIQKYEEISTSSAYSMIRELQVQQILSKIPQSSETTPKQYFSGIIDGKIVVITKIISGGEAKNCLPHLSIKGRLKAFLGFGKGLKMLHDAGITHNDVAMRNMLVELSSEKVKVEKSIGSWLAKPILDNTGKRIIKGSTLITHEISDQLKKLNIKKIKVFSKEDPQGKLTDFGLCTFTSESLDPLNTIYYAADSISPECHIAISAHDKALAEYNKSHNLTEEQKRYKHDEVLKAAQNVAKVMTIHNDLLPFGQMLCHVILQPGLDTNLDRNNWDRSYFESSKKRLLNMNIAYKIAADPTQENIQRSQSAIAYEDYEKIKLISLPLADLVFNLQRYIPSERTKLDDALNTLKEIIEKDQFSVTLLESQHTHLENSLDLILKNSASKEETSNQSESSNGSTSYESISS